jgi:hypothetical protein
MYYINILSLESYDKSLEKKFNENVNYNKYQYIFRNVLNKVQITVIKIIT